MNFLAVILLSLFISVKSSIATQEDGTFHENTKTNVKSSNATQEDRTFHKNTKTNGLAGLSTVFTNDTKHESQLTRPRRSEIREDDEAPCYRQFFVRNQPPKGFGMSNAMNRYAYICQQDRFSKAPLFSTMFDLDYGIPIYSAYVVTQEQAKHFGDVSRSGKKFRPEKGIPANMQGSDEMYRNPGLLPCINKGHLVPAETYSFSDAHLRSTFTYTNAVPQYATFNKGQWAEYEDRIRDYAKVCSQKEGDLYLLTGISDVKIGIQGKSRKVFKEHLFHMPEEPKIVIPNSMWTAGCCVSVRGKKALRSFALFGNNDPNKSNIRMSQMWVETLAGFIDVKRLFPAIRNCNNRNHYVYLT